MTFLECFGLMVLIGFNVSALAWLIARAVCGPTEEPNIAAAATFLLTSVLFVAIQLFGG